MSLSCSSSLRLCCSNNLPTLRCWHINDHCTWVGWQQRLAKRLFTCSTCLNKVSSKFPPAPVFGRGRPAGDPGRVAVSAVLERPAFLLSKVFASQWELKPSKACSVLEHPAFWSLWQLTLNLSPAKLLLFCSTQHFFVKSFAGQWELSKASYVLERPAFFCQKFFHYATAQF